MSFNTMKFFFEPLHLRYIVFNFLYEVIFEDEDRRAAACTLR